jgi:hypothetical protein
VLMVTCVCVCLLGKIYNKSVIFDKYQHVCHIRNVYSMQFLLYHTDYMLVSQYCSLKALNDLEASLGSEY